MTKTEQQRIEHQTQALKSLGFTADEVNQLRRISMTLRRWYEKECGIDGGCIERDELTDKPYWRSAYSGKRWIIADHERGALKRLALIIDAVNRARRTAYAGAQLAPKEPLDYYVQTDPRGAALYILRPGDVPKGEWMASYYNRGIVVY